MHVVWLWEGKEGDCWSPPSADLLKFNADKAAKGKPDPSVIGGVLSSCERKVLYVFSKNVGVSV